MKQGHGTSPKVVSRARRHRRVRARVIGTATRPRLSVFRSLKAVFVQLIDDEQGKTLCSAHSQEITKPEAGDRTGKVALSYAVGSLIAQKAKALPITHVVFDRGGYAYMGRVSAVADGARDGGLIF